MDVTVDVPASPSAAAVVRRQLEPLREHIAGGCYEDLRLIVSELVSNSARHSGMPEGTPIHVHIDADGQRIHGEITDRGSGFDPTPRPPKADSGWGLNLVRQLAKDWGVRRNGGTTVWFELPAAPAKENGSFDHARRSA